LGYTTRAGIAWSGLGAVQADITSGSSASIDKLAVKRIGLFLLDCGVARLNIADVGEVLGGGLRTGSFHVGDRAGEGGHLSVALMEAALIAAMVDE
jgi:hypothetical protein